MIASPPVAPPLNADLLMAFLNQHQQQMNKRAPNNSSIPLMPGLAPSFVSPTGHSQQPSLNNYWTLAMLAAATRQGDTFQSPAKHLPPPAPHAPLPSNVHRLQYGQFAQMHAFHQLHQGVLTHYYHQMLHCHQQQQQQQQLAAAALLQGIAPGPHQYSLQPSASTSREQSPQKPQKQRKFDFTQLAASCCEGGRANAGAMARTDGDGSGDERAEEEEETGGGGQSGSSSSSLVMVRGGLRSTTVENNLRFIINRLAAANNRPSQTTTAAMGMDGGVGQMRMMKPW